MNYKHIILSTCNQDDQICAQNSQSGYKLQSHSVTPQDDRKVYSDTTCTSKHSYQGKSTSRVTFILLAAMVYRQTNFTAYMVSTLKWFIAEFLQDNKILYRVVYPCSQAHYVFFGLIEWLRYDI